MDRKEPITAIKGIGEKTKGYFQKLQVETIGDLLRYYPRDYEHFEPPVSVNALCEGKRQAVCCVLTKNPSVRRIKNLQIVTASAEDETGSLSLTWFNMPYLKGALKAGNRYVFRGKAVKKGRGFSLEQSVFYREDTYRELAHSLSPIYPLTKGLKNKLISQSVKTALQQCGLEPEHLPEWIRETYHLAEYNYAIETIHFPKDETELLFARRRLVFEEFFFFILALQKFKEGTERERNHFSLPKEAQTGKLLQSLPYELTGAQKKVWEEIRADLEGPYRMNRLIQGDVGSGKTVLAVLALLKTVENGFQGALMAPTEVLARQHYEGIREYFQAAGIEKRLLLLTGSMTAKEKRLAYEAIGNHEVDIIVGTHALFQEKVHYDHLALVITDEQHRFGVRQRELLARKGGEVFHPHVLVMSATPIPRTLALILYGDLDISILDELPQNRLPIKNAVVDESYRQKAWSFLGKEVQAGHQAYVICPMVEAGEMLELENVVDYTKKLRAAMPSQVSVAYLHGKMKAGEKNRIMESFASGEISILVSTTVVEVGVNVPNATVMMVENAERFGLAQLHQLRGRVGRGKAQSYCIFVNTSGDQRQNKRLEILKKSNDGFFIASEDLKLRGPGDFFGVRQSGAMEFAIGDIFTDGDLLKEASQAAKKLLKEDPGLQKEKNQGLKRFLDEYIKEGAKALPL